MLQALYVRGDDLLAVMRPLVTAPVSASDWQTRYYHADGIGSIRRLTDESGNITDGYTYSAFGELLAHTGTDPQPYAFTGDPLDPNSGFQYHRARWMDPKTGRFASIDPWEGNSFDPPTLHRYLYGANDPLNKVDPSGRQSMGELAAVGAMLGALTNIAIVQPRGVLNTINVGLAGALAGMAAAAVLAYAAGVTGASLAVGAAGTVGTVGTVAARVAIVDGPILENTLARNSERLWLGEFYGARFFERGQWHTWPGTATPQAGLLWIQNMMARFGGYNLNDLPRSIDAMKPAINAAPQIVFNISNLSPNSLALQEFNYIMASPALADKTIFVTNVVVH